MPELAKETKHKRNKNKIGARCLSLGEAKMILPTYPQIQIQIDQFRSERESDNKKENINQKTNNIGIIGVRGAGKTSLLKTIREELMEKNTQGQDLIFPIIVPENMSESSTLMATILGMMKKYVDEKDKKEKQAGGYPDCERGNGIVKQYKEAVKQYTFIQREYRDILIHEYTTENDYAESSTKIFNSDIEFITKFHELVSALLSGREKGMLFLFIDDIDLSTHRCTDVVKTLLSYLSNENIVTFISGDLETFEEALTVDFLRQEKVLGKDVLGESMLENPKAGTFLDSKKKLAYEYLKKILPPVYRHNIKEWALEEKGTYCIQEEEGDTGKDFAWYLSEALEGWVDPAFFQYYEEGTGMGALPYTYHLFDNTSRGLNNVYNVLKEIAFLQKSWKEGFGERELSEEDVLGKKQQLLDTIISSKHLYNQHRSEIYGNMFYVGSKGGQVFFDNAMAIIYEKRDYDGELRGSVEELDNWKRKPVDRFSLFLLVDLAARLFYEAEYEVRVGRNKDYHELKKLVMEDLIRYPEIAGKVMPVKNHFFEWMEVEELKELKELKEITIYFISTSFLTKGSLVFNLAVYRNLHTDTLAILHQIPDEELSNMDFDTAQLEQDVFLAFWKAVSSVGKVRNEEDLLLETYYPVFWKEFEYMQRQMSSVPIQNAVIKLFDEECERAISSVEKPSKKIKRFPLKRILINTIAEYAEPVWEENEDMLDASLIEGEDSDETDGNKDDEKIYKIIEIISKRRLWREEAAGKVVDYLSKKVGKGMEQIISDILQSDWNIATGRAISAWQDFVNSYDGVSETRSVMAKREVRRLLKKEAFGEEDKPVPSFSIEKTLRNGISFDTFCQIVEEVLGLSQNDRVWYGQREAQELLNGFLKCFANSKEEEKRAEFQFFLCHYFIYKTFIGNNKEIHQQAELMKEITEQLSKAHKNADRNVLNSFIDQLNEALKEDEQINQEEFEYLFG